VSADWLDSAVRAARDVEGTTARRAAETRRAVLLALAAGTSATRAPRRAFWLVVAPAILVAGVCAAAIAPHASIASRLGLAPPAGAQEASHDAARATHGPGVLPSASQLLPPPVALPPATAQPTADSGASSSPPIAPPRSASERGPASTASDLEELYARAHALHFGQHDAARALAAWDRYLTVAPPNVRRGLVLEARYNRAICLVRLGRRDEARSALRPFAEGRWGAYRRDDARRLLDTMGDAEGHGPGP
jgi:hypothetical protein